MLKSTIKYCSFWHYRRHLSIFSLPKYSRQNYGTILPARAGPVLAQQLSQMLLLRRDARGHRLQLLHPQWHDPVQGRLLQVSAPNTSCPALAYKKGVSFCFLIIRTSKISMKQLFRLKTTKNLIVLAVSIALSKGCFEDVLGYLFGLASSLLWSCNLIVFKPKTAGPHDRLEVIFFLGWLNFWPPSTAAQPNCLVLLKKS